MIFDTHAHYDDSAFGEDRVTLIEEMQSKQVGMIVNIGASLASNERTLELVEQYQNIYAAFGIHPNDADTLNSYHFDRIKELCNHPKCVAVGEIGLDYYYSEPAKEIQKEWFIKQMDFAREIKKPIVIHSRDAAKDTLDMMVANQAKDLGGIMHCFSYSKEIAKTVVDMGFYIGVGGVVTFNNGKKLKEVVEYIPMEHIVLETDCPYLSPVPYRGKRNDSTLLHHVVQEIATIKGITTEEVEDITWRNAMQVYSMKEKI
ncbi:MAG: TatD family hydrolase [Lachnospiraceae bacterium]